MAAVDHIDSNVAESRISEETSFKVANGSAVWALLEVNQYNDARAQYAKVAASPITADRQRRKGVTVDLDSMFGANIDLTHYNQQDLLQGVFFADFREKTTATSLTSVNGANGITAGADLDVFAVGDLVVLRGGTAAAGNSNRVLRVTALTGDTVVTVAETLVAETLPAGAKLVKVGVRAAAGDLDISAAGNFPTMTSTTLDFTTLGFVAGESIWIGGDAANTFYTNDENNCMARIRSISANVLTFDKASKDAMVTEASTTETIEIYFGRVLKNEQLADFVRRTYQIEMQLGAPDDAQPSQIQSQYFTGCVANEYTLTLEQGSKIASDIRFVGAGHETYSGAEGLKAGTRPNTETANRQNTATDLKRVRISRIVSGDEAPVPLFAFIPTFTLNINNEVQPLKALTVLGAFGMSQGDFVVTASLEGYFVDIAAISAIKDNASLTIDLMCFNGNQGWVIDLPLCTAGDGSVNVQKGQAMRTPLTIECASGEEVDPALDYTAMWTFFDGLPNRASEPNEVAA